MNNFPVNNTDRPVEDNGRQLQDLGDPVPEVEMEQISHLIQFQVYLTGYSVFGHT